MVFNPKAIVYHANHPDNAFQYARLKFWRGYWRMSVYERYKSKMMHDSYTPKTLKFQVLCVYFLVLSGLLFPLFPLYSSIILAACFAGFLSSIIGFILHAAQHDLLISALSPYFLFLRAFSLGSGSGFWLFCRFFKLFYSK